MNHRSCAAGNPRACVNPRPIVTPTCEPLERRAHLSSAGGMSNVGETLLPSGVGASYSAAIDPTTGFGYFGSTGTGSAVVLSKVNLNGPEPVVVQDGLPSTIPAGVSGLLAVLIDTSNPNPADHFLYVGCATGQVLKMSPGDATHDPQVVAVLKPTSASGTIFCGSIDPAAGYAYYGIAGNGGVKVLRVQLSTFTDAGSETVATPNNENSIRMMGIDTVRHYLYVSSFGTGYAANSTIPYLAKLNLTTFHAGGTSTATLRLDSTTPGDGIARAGYDLPTLDEGLVIDAVHGYAYLGTYTVDRSPGTPKIDTWPYDQSLVARIALGPEDAFPANPVQTLDLPVGQRDLTTVQLDPVNGNLYFGTDNTYPAHIYEVHVGDGTVPMAETGVLDLNTVPGVTYPLDGNVFDPPGPGYYGEYDLRSSVFDAAQNAIYFGTDSMPGQVIRVDINGSAMPAGPAAPSEPQLAPGSESSTSDDITNVTTPTFIGTAEPGSTVELFDRVTPLGSTPADASGNWAYTSGVLSDGTHLITATATDATGTSAPSPALSVVIDTFPPTIPMFALDASSETPPLSANATTLASVTLTGQTDPGVAVQLLQTGATATADAGGVFHFPGVSLALGANTFTVVATDAAGNQSTYSTTITRLPAPPPPPPPPPGTGKIVFQSNRDGPMQIYSMNADGSDVVRLTDDTYTDVEPRVSLNGSEIVFASNRSGGFQLYEMNSAGQDLRQLTITGAMDPSFSPDGSHIVYRSTTTGKGQIYMMNADGSENVRVTNDAGNDIEPWFSPSGQIVFASDMNTPGRDQLYLVNANGTGLARLTNDATSDFAPAFSPDGSHIAYESTLNSITEIDLTTPAGAAPLDLTGNASSNILPVFSPNGQSIAFSSSRDGNSQIYTMALNGSDQTRLTTDPGSDVYPSWSD